MARTLPSALSSALVLCAALAACSDAAAPTAPREQPADNKVEAANRNVSDGARVFQITGDEVRSTSVEQTGTPVGTQQLVNYQCPGYVASGTMAQAAYYGCEPYEPYEPYEPTPVTPTPVTPTPVSVYANFTYGSDASGISNIVANGTILKTLTLSSFSQAIQNVASTSLNASFRNVGGQTSCSSVAGQFDSSYSSGGGSPLYLSTSRSPAWQGVIKWQVNGTHGFTPISGAGGGGTFSSSDFTCG